LSTGRVYIYNKFPHQFQLFNSSIRQIEELNNFCFDFRFAGAHPGQPVVQWVAMPATMPGVPRGLEYLTQVDQLLVHQLVEVLERK